MKQRYHLAGLLTVILLLPVGRAVATNTAYRPRIIATTDGEVDDRCSMIRFLLYTNDGDVCGLIHSSSKYHWLGNDKVARHDWHDVSWLNEQLDAYAATATDPDGDSLSYNWWHYQQASSYTAAVAIDGPSNGQAKVRMPNDARRGETVHLICTVTDRGSPPLTRYQRVIVTCQQE